jgi:hypothetical protein
MKIAHHVLIAYNAANEPTCLYVGDDVSAAEAELLDVHDGGTYVRAQLLNISGRSNVLKQWKSLPVTGDDLARMSA